MQPSDAQRLAEFDSNCALLAVPVATPLETLESLLVRDRRRPRSASFIERVQCDGMTASWRHKMSHWMFETGSAFEMACDTVACAVCLMDEYLSVHSVSKHQLQLLSLVSLSAASKMHETQPISLDEMLVLCESKFSRSALWKMEAELMKTIDWRLDPPTAFSFARALAAASTAPSYERLLLDAATPILRDSTEDYAALRFRSPTLATAAVFLAAKLQSVDVSATLAIVLSELSAPPPLIELVECFKYLTSLHTAKDPAETLVTLRKLAPDAGARSPCSVDDDVGRCNSQQIDFAWVVEFRVCVENGMTGDTKSCPKREHKRNRSDQRSSREEVVTHVKLMKTRA